GATTIKLGVVTKPGSAQNIVAEKFKELVEQRSNGELEVKIFHFSNPLIDPSFPPSMLEIVFSCTGNP
ncbi:MAG: hypothetical protein HKN69_07640, partial [Desulfofustis sp.]|nr:hypothetical protein [Desulfofustis sp.]